MSLKGNGGLPYHQFLYRYPRVEVTNFQRVSDFEVPTLSSVLDTRGPYSLFRESIFHLFTLGKGTVPYDSRFPFRLECVPTGDVDVDVTSFYRTLRSVVPLDNVNTTIRKPSKIKENVTLDRIDIY